MTKTILKIIGVLVLAILEVSTFHYFSIFGIVPNFIFILGLVLLMQNYFDDSLLVLVVGGIFLDITVSHLSGFFTVSFLLIFLLNKYFLMKHLSVQNIFYSLINVLISLFLFDLFICIGTYSWPGLQFLISILINLFWSILFYYLLKKISRQQEKIIISG